MRLRMGNNTQRELDGPVCSAWMTLKQLSEIGCDFHTGETPPKAMTCPHFDLTAFVLPLGSCLSVPAKVALAHTFKLNAPLCLTMIPLFAVPARQHMTHLTALACDSVFGHAVCQAT